MRTIQRTVSRLIAKAIREYGLIEAGDRILVAVSGGKDSTALAKELELYRRHSKIPFTLLAVHIASDFCACCKKSGIVKLLEDLGLPYEEIKVAIVGRLKVGESMNCWWCSTQRRTELIKYAERMACGKLALGHHLDDIVETLFMNMLQKGEFSTMPPLMKYDKYPVSIIRPLALVEERQIIDYAEAEGFKSVACTCPYGVDSKRRDVRRRIEALTGGSSEAKRRIFASMGNIRKEYLA